MRVPTLRGVIARRILVNYRVDPDVLAKLLPAPFQPKLIDGLGMAGICLIRLSQLRPPLLPGVVGVTSENAAHRIAVRWQDADGWHEGVYIPRRDTASRFNTLVGGRLFPGYHHHARFQVREQDDRFRVVVDSDDGTTHVAVVARLAGGLPPTSIFPSLEAASAFFEQGAVGYSPGGESGELQGLRLHSFNWKIEPLAVSRVESSFFADPHRFPPGSCTFDCALLMRHIAHEWHEQDAPCLTEAA
jgi:hypothetical protein